MPEWTLQPDDSPVPPRYWWLKRIMLASVVFLVLLLALRLWWGWEAHRRLQAEIDRIIAAGEPIYPADFAPKDHVADNENAATQYLRAGSRLAYPAFRAIYEFPDDPGAWHDRRDEVQVLLQDHGMALVEVRAARQLGKADWHIIYASPVIDTLLPTLSEQCALSKLLCIAVRHEHTNGKDSNTTATILDALSHLGTMEKHPFLVVHMQVCRSAIRLGWTIESVAPSLAISTDSGSSITVSSASDVRAIIADLLDEKASEDALVHGMLEERMAQLDTVHHVLRGSRSVAQLLETFNNLRKHWGPVESRLFSPAIAREGVVLIREASSMVEASRQRTYPAAQEMLPVSAARNTDPWYVDAHLACPQFMYQPL